MVRVVTENERKARRKEKVSLKYLPKYEHIVTRRQLKISKDEQLYNETRPIIHGSPRDGQES